MTIATRAPESATEIVRAYHERTKHRLEGYARGPETLDWDAQPNPFREFTDAPRVQLPFAASRIETLFNVIGTPKKIAPAAPTSENLAALLELSFGLSAWKEYGPDRWALRCNPSSGNLHPTEAYAFVQNIAGVEGGLYHYVSRDHALERRCNIPEHATITAPRLFVGLTSLHWREAWKYGERAFRYCQLDIGHALGALRYAAAALGWKVHVLGALDAVDLAAILGLDRDADFAGVEHEEADLLAAIDFFGDNDSKDIAVLFEAQHWAGRANRIDPHPIYQWPIIDDVSIATRRSRRDEADDFRPSDYERPHASGATRAVDLILKRRSAQRFDAHFTMSRADFDHLLLSILPGSAAPWDIWEFRPRLHPVFFIHRVDGLEPGLYTLLRHPSAEEKFRASLDPAFTWERPPETPDTLPFFRLALGDFRKHARTLNCHQAIGGESCFALGMLSEFEDVVEADPWRYRQLHWEAGLLGHVLYLQAEALGHRATGIGCFFDDAFHGLIGVKSWRLQTLYHLALGRPLLDTRITTLPAYPGRP